MNLGAKVKAYNLHCNQSFGTEKANSLDEALRGSDDIIIATDHSEFKNLNLQEIKILINEKPVLIDGPKREETDNSWNKE
ncbi:MAG: UDP binding domain-containing protein [Nitrososphaerota archaeon]